MERVVESAGAEVDERGSVVSFWVRLRARISNSASNAHVARQREVNRLAVQSMMTPDIQRSLDVIVASLRSSEEAVVRVGALLMIKTEDSIAVHQLTADQQLMLDHKPELLRSLDELRRRLSLPVKDEAASAGSDIDPISMATGINDATKALDHIFNILGPPPEPSGSPAFPGTTDPVGVS